MMRNIGKARIKSFHKKVKQLVHEYGGIPAKTKLTLSGYDYEMDTKAGPLGITLHEKSDLEGTSVFSIFCRFHDVKKANSLLTNSAGLNQYSGKWNFHFKDEEHCLYAFETELKAVVTDKPITDYAALEKLLDKNFEAPNKIVAHDEILEGRLSIDPIRLWSNVHGRTGLVVICNGVSMNIRKTTPFQIWIKGVEL